MFNNVAFDVVIGLVFVYLLYSLLITIVSEVIATNCGIRARLLRVAIERMLNDGYYQKIERKKKKFWQTWLRKTFLYEPKEFKQSFAGKFYQYPAIKYLSRIEKSQKGLFSSTKPSYITAEYFADSLISFLADKGSGATEMEKISFSLKFNTYHIQPKTLRQLLNMFESAGGDKELYKKNIIKWYNETMDRTNGWYKRKMRVISFLLGFIVAASFNIDTIRIGKILSNDKEARNQLVNMGIALSKDSSRYKDYLLVNKDTVHDISVLDTGFVRVTKDINAANFVLGSGWNFRDSLKKEEIEIDTIGNARLSNQTKSLDSLIMKRNNLLASIRDSSNEISKNSFRIDSLIHDTTVCVNEILLADSVSQKTSWEKKLENDTVLIKKINLRNKILVSLLKNDSSRLRAVFNLSKPVIEAINQQLELNLIQVDSTQRHNKTILIYGRRRYSFWEKLGTLAQGILWFNVIGFLITALALSLGAPFWFDLLNKLVSIRGVGIKPEEKKPVQQEPEIINQNLVAPPPPVVPTTNTGTDVVEEALNTYFTKLRSIPGVKSVFTVMQNGIKTLQVNVNDNNTRNEVLRQFPNINIGSVAVPFNVAVSGIPVSHQGVITNRSGRNGFGSLSCVLIRRDTKSKHLLSCWHVLKGDLNYSTSDDEPFILDNNTQIVLAERWAGGIQNQFDYGLAICESTNTYKDNSFLKKAIGAASTIKFTCRIISKKDVDTQIPVKYYDALNNKLVEGIIYSDSDEVDIDYLDKTRTVKDVLLLTATNAIQSISTGGNSGALIFDQKNYPIAMIIGGDDQYTYAAKLAHVFEIHSEMEIL